MKSPDLRDEGYHHVLNKMRLQRKKRFIEFNKDVNTWVLRDQQAEIIEIDSDKEETNDHGHATKPTLYRLKDDMGKKTNTLRVCTQKRQTHIVNNNHQYP